MSLTHVVVFTSYIDLVVQRATGELPTPAAWIRTFVQSHPAYKHDSVVSQEVGQKIAMWQYIAGDKVSNFDACVLACMVDCFRLAQTH